MSKILTQEEIDALLRNVSQGQSVSAIEESKERSSHLYDFKHPDRISKEQLRTLRTIHDGFARTFGTYLSTSLRTMVDINLLSIDQVAYGEYMLALSVPSCIYVISSKNLKGSGILEIAPQFALMLVDRLLGGSGSRVDRVREITIIEQNILKRVVDKALVILNDAWHHIVPVNLYVESFESNPQFVQIAPASETAAVIFFEIVVRDMTLPLNICFPYFVLEPLLQHLADESWMALTRRRGSVQEVSDIRARLQLTPLVLTVQLGQTTIRLRDLLNLQQGSILALNERRDQELKIRVNGKVKFWAMPGTSNNRKAVKILRRVSPYEEVIHE
ncbi:MAG: flagellar motor switch protein FliM [bacterium]